MKKATREERRATTIIVNVIHTHDEDLCGPGFKKRFQI